MSKVVDILTVKAERRGASSRFILEATDVGAGRMSWTWWLEDTGDDGRRPTERQVAAQLRRVARGYERKNGNKEDVR